MVSAILNALREGKTFSQFELAERFRTTPETIMAGLDFLKKGGYVRQVCAQGNCSGCSKKCFGCTGGGAAPRNPFLIWEAADKGTSWKPEVKLQEGGRDIADHVKNTAHAETPD
jgi:predicted ArsR family transcriptional regulator